jgi:hypothetical protein
VSSSRAILGYHSAHAPDVDAPRCARVEVGESVALVHDAATGVLPGDYAACDVLYADLPWPYGLDTFNARAAVSQTFPAVMAGIASIVERAWQPTFVVCGKTAERRLPTPDVSAPIRLNQWAAVVLGYRVTDLPELPAVPTDSDLIAALANRFGRVGDFCCGYGRTLRLFAKRGKAFTGSDYNPHCIGYIAEHAREWAADE